MRFIFSTFLIVISITCSATQIDERQAKMNAEKFIAESFCDTRTTRSSITERQSLSLCYVRQNLTTGYPLIYVFNQPNDNGFVVAAGDDCVNEVLGYADHGNFDVNDIPNGLLWLIEKYEYQMMYAIKHNIRIKSNSRIRSGYSEILPLLKSTWNQDTPYNDLCPISKNGRRCPTGCIATAMAQILYYHQWPQQGKGLHSYVCNVDNDKATAIELTADFGNTVYKWDKMLDSYKNGLGSIEAKQAVATLMYHVGVSLDMLYQDGGSSPTRIKEAMALKDYFRYSADVKSLLHVSDPDFTTIVYEELANKRPVFVCGGSKTQKNGAHAFVCDGYREGDYFHFNWGWAGKGDGYYLLTTMDPPKYPNDNWDFSYDHRIVYNIKPYKGEIPSGAVEVRNLGAGQLEDAIKLNEAANYSTFLKVVGDLNGTDMLTLRKMAGRNENNEETEGIVTSLDLSEANIVDGGDSYYKDIVGTKANIFPERGLQSTHLKYVKLPESITTIDKYALAFCYDLETVEFGNSLQKIGFSAFNYTPMREIIIPEGIETIGPYAFCNMNNLEKVQIAKSVKKIDYKAFEKDDNIKEIICLIETPFNLHENDVSVFSEACYKNAILCVPFGTVDQYKQKKGWRNFTKIIELEQTAIEDVFGGNIISLSAKNGILNISGVKGNNTIKVYDVSGRLIYSNHSNKDEFLSICIPRKTIMIVKVGNQQFKVISD